MLDTGKIFKKSCIEIFNFDNELLWKWSEAKTIFHELNFA